VIWGVILSEAVLSTLVILNGGSVDPATEPESKDPYKACARTCAAATRLGLFILHLTQGSLAPRKTP